MMKAITEKTIQDKIYIIREQKVMIDNDLAEMYNVPTKQLKQAVKRNADRFPKDFMFELTREEAARLSRSQFVTLKQGTNIKYLPFAFTEHGVLMLSSVLRSEQAIQVNIRIMRVYAKMKTLLLQHKDILLKLERLEKKTASHDEEIKAIFAVIKKLVASPATKKERIGFDKNW